MGALFRALMLLECPGRTRDLEQRSLIASEIARASRLSRYYLLKKFSAGDSAVQLWRERQAAKIAAAISEKQTWLITPRSETREALKHWLAHAVVALASGSWGELDLAGDSQLTDVAPRTRWLGMLAFAMKYLRVVTVASVPMVVYFVAHWLGILVEADIQVTGYIKAGAIAWAALTIVFQLDPQAKERVSIIVDGLSKLAGKRDNG